MTALPSVPLDPTLPGEAAGDPVRAAVDALAARFAGPGDAGEVARAREAFDARRGRVFDDDDIHLTHLAAFLEWYLLERPLGGGPAPVVRALADPRPGDPPAPLLRALALGHRSLFAVRGARPAALLLDDLVSGGRWLAGWSAPGAPPDPGDIFEARLMLDGDGLRFGPVFLFHPREAREPITRFLAARAAAGTLDAAAIDALAERRLRYGRFRNIAVDRIY